MKTKHLQYFIIVFLIIFSSEEVVAQKDSLALQRKARKMVREGNELYKKEQFTDASVAYQKAVSNAANYNKATYNLGNALYQNKNYKEAVPQFELTAKTATDKFTKAEAFHNIGNAMLETKQYQQAVNAYKNALRNNSSDDETRYNLAVAQELLKKEENENKDDKNKDKDKKDKDNKDKDKKDKDEKNKDKDKKDGDDKDKKDEKDKKDDGDKGDKEKNKDKKDEQKKPKPQQGKMTPQQMKQLLESLNNEEKKTQKKMNAKKAQGKKVKQEKDW